MRVWSRKSAGRKPATTSYANHKRIRRQRLTRRRGGRVGVGWDNRRGLVVERQKAVAFDYDGMHFEEGLRIDLLVNGCVVIELKSVEKLSPVHAKQLLTYLRLMKLPVGLLINFGASTLKEGLQRVVNNLSPSASPRLRVNQP